MGILDDVQRARQRVVERRQQRSWPVGKGSLASMDERWGHDTSEFAPNSYGEYAATSNEVYSVIQLRARLMSSLELKLFNGSDSDKVEDKQSPAAKLLRYVNPFWSPRRLARMDELSMGLWGESFWAIERKAGVPAEIWWMKPSRVKPVPHKDDYLQGFLYESETGGQIPFAANEVIWFRYPNPIDEFSPLSPLAAARLAADTAKSMMSSNNKLFTNGLQLGGVISPATDKVSFSKEQADDLALMLDKRMAGADKAHRWAVMRFEAQFKQMNITPKDAEFLAGLNMSLRQVCNAYGIPSPLLNDLEHATLANMNPLMRMAWENTLVPDSLLKADDVREQLLPMFRGGPDHCEHDYSKVPSLQESASESWGRERQAIDVGAITINEWRKGKGLPPVPWGNVFWAPVNKSAVTDETSTPQGDTEPAGDPILAAALADDERAFRALFSDLMAPALNGHRRP